MKRYICSLAVCVMMLSAHAQNKMNIVKADGQVETYPTTAVNSVETSFPRPSSFSSPLDIHDENYCRTQDLALFWFGIRSS